MTCKDCTNTQKRWNCVGCVGQLGEYKQMNAVHCEVENDKCPYYTKTFTNGEMLKTVFPVEEVIGTGDPGKWLDVHIKGNMWSKFSKDWWNAPYTNCRDITCKEK